MSVVSYDSDVRLEFGLTHMDDDSKGKTKALVKAISNGSSTNLCGGLLKGNYSAARLHKTGRTF